MIPEQIRGYNLLRVENSGKAPVDGPNSPKPLSEIRLWVRQGGNYGVAVRSTDDLVIIDVDSHELQARLKAELPETFTVMSGGDGIGFHYYYRVPGWDRNQQVTVDGTDRGSIRSENWYAVGPGSVHPSGQEYQIVTDTGITEVSCDSVEKIAGQTAANTAAAAARVGGSQETRPIPDIPTQYPSKPAEWETLRTWLGANDFLTELDRENYPQNSEDRSGHEFKLAKCLAEGGFSRQSISRALDRLPSNSKWCNRGRRYQKRTVRKAIKAALDDEYVSFEDTADMEPDGSERRKTESGDEDRITIGGENMANYNEKESVNLLEGSEDGESFKKVSLMERIEGGESVEYVALKEGYVEERDTVSGETVLTKNVTDSSSLGSPDYIDDLSEALAELGEEIED